MKSHRTPPHDLENIMPLLIGIWRKTMKLGGPDDRLQTREFRTVVDAVQQKDSRSIGAHLLYEWVIHYQEGLSLIGELPKVPEKVLDLGSGAIPFGFAALKHGASDVVAIDKEQKWLELGSQVCGRYGFPVKTLQADILKMKIKEKFDLIVVGHALEEFFPLESKGWQSAQEEWIYQLLTLLNPEGHLLMVESSFEESNQRILHLRESMVNRGVAILAPCVFRGSCPVLNTPQNPCYAQRTLYKPYLIKEIQRAASINLSSLKMSYLIFKDLSSGWPKIGSNPLFRVISPPVESFHGKTFYLCGTTGKAKLSSRLDEHPKESKAFDYLRRGELISIEDAYKNENELIITEGTKVTVKAACGKPVDEDHE